MKKITLCLLTMMAIVSVNKLSAQKKRLPNIIYILADDMGYGDLSANNPEAGFKTPHIDQLTEQGMRFTDAHTTSGVCTPSRYSILTGRYPWRSRLPDGVLKGYSRTLIDDWTPTVAAMLKTRNYHTGVVGKWHLGFDWVTLPENRSLLNNPLYGILEEMNPKHIDFSKQPTKGPKEQGFDYSYVLPASLDMPPYCYLENGRLVEPLSATTKGSKPDTGYTGAFWREGLMSPNFDFFGVVPRFVEKATDFIEKSSKSTQPFFLYFPMPAPHTPWMPTPAYRGATTVGEYGDYMKMVDDAVATITKKLDDLHIAENTLLVFTSDNGPYWRINYVQKYHHNSAGIFRGMKGDVFEAGHRVPFVVRYPGVVKAGSVSRTTITQASFFATCADLVGIKDPHFQTEDSYSILPVLKGKAADVEGEEAIVHFSSKGTYAIRKGPWKLITKLGSGGMTNPAEIKPEPGGPTGQLYNLETDIREEHNLFLQYPEKVKELSELLERIRSKKIQK